MSHVVSKNHVRNVPFTHVIGQMRSFTPTIHSTGSTAHLADTPLQCIFPHCTTHTLIHGSHIASPVPSYSTLSHHNTITSLVIITTYPPLPLYTTNLTKTNRRNKQTPPSNKPMSAFRFSSLWQRRASTDSTTSTDPITPPDAPPFRLDVDHPNAPLPQRRAATGDKRRVKRRASGKKPPVAPPLASGAPTFVEEEDLLPEGVSPVSSFVDSTPNSPTTDSAHARINNVEALRKRICVCDTRISELEQRQRCMLEEIERINRLLRNALAN